jgi:hypothetical protein
MEEEIARLQAENEELRRQVAFHRLEASELPAVREDRAQVVEAHAFVMRVFSEFIEVALAQGVSHEISCQGDPCGCWLAPYIKVAKDL